MIPAVLLTWQYRVSSVRGHFSTLFEPELLINAEVPPETIAPVAAPAIAPDAVLDAPLLSTGGCLATFAGAAALPLDVPHHCHMFVDRDAATPAESVESTGWWELT